MRKFIFLLVTVIAVMLTGSTFMAPAANADYEVEIEITNRSAAETEFSAEATAVSRAKVNDKIQLSYWANPEPWTYENAIKCKLISVNIDMTTEQIQSKIGGRNCVRLTKGSTWANSGKDGTRVVPVKSTVKGDWSLMVKLEPGFWAHMGGYVAGQGFVIMRCQNKWLIGKKPTLDDDDVLWVKTEAEVRYSSAWNIR